MGSFVQDLRYSLWATHFGSDPDVLGRLIRGLTGEPIAVVGVMPPGFAFPRRDTSTGSRCH